MKKIENYDIITLDNGEEYTLFKRIKENGKTYDMLIGIDEDEMPIIDDIKLVEEKEEKNEIIFKEISTKEEIKKVSKLFLISIRKEIE